MDGLPRFLASKHVCVCVSRLICSALLATFASGIATPHFLCAAEPQPADLVVLDATVITIDEERPSAEAFAVRDERIVAVGETETVRAWIGPETTVIKARGKTVVPGFNDAHCHPTPLFDEMSRLGKVDCSPDAVDGIDKLIERLKIKADRTPKGQWVRGSRYQDTKLGRHLTRVDLDRVSTSHPVYVSHSSGHLAAVNSVALELAGVDASTPNPKGGAFDRDDDGDPNGLLRESAKGIVMGAGPELPQPTTAEWIEGMKRRFDRYLEHGITSVQHAGTSPRTLRKYALVLAEHPLLRINVMLRRSNLDVLKQLNLDPQDQNQWLRTGAIKTFHGNSLSGRTCWLYEPYADRPEYYGIPPAASQDELNRKVLEIHEAGFQACIHANGDREIDMVLNAYEHALEQHPRDDHRHRIEHASVCNEHILERVKRLGVVLATHSYVWEHGDKMEAYGEQRWRWMHPNGSATQMGIPIAGNSDSPVSAAKPLLRIQSMVTRTSAEGKVYGAEQRITVEQAIRAWTLGSAFASFEESEKGSITKGKLADFVVLAKDPRAVSPEEIKDISIELTVIGGKVGYQADDATLVDTSAAAALETEPPRGQRLIGKLGRGPAKENSGIVKSRNYDDVFWMQNDSGDEPRVYAIHADGTPYRGTRYSDTPGTLIGGAINVDWEDIAVTKDGCLIVADVGNNSNERRDLVLYFVAEPPPRAGRTTYRKRVFVRYPEQPSHPAPRNDFNYDCEAVYTIGDNIYLLTKHRSDTRTRVYRVSAKTLGDGETHDLELLQEREMQGQVVAADARPDGSQLIVATYDTLWLFDVDDPDEPLAHPTSKLPFVAEQVEAVCFDGDRVLFADEATANLYEAALADFTPLPAE